MADATYYQEGAAGLGKPDASSEKPSTEALSPNDAAPEANGTEVVTKAELQRIKAEIEESVLRKTQSMTDKLGSKLDVRIKTAQDEAEKAIRMLKASGVALTPEQERSISQTAVNEALTAKEASEAAQHQEAQSKPNDFVNVEVRKIMKRTGVYLEPDEANALIGEVDSPLTSASLRKSANLAPLDHRKSPVFLRCLRATERQPALIRFALSTIRRFLTSCTESTRLFAEAM